MSSVAVELHSAFAPVTKRTENAELTVPFPHAHRAKSVGCAPALQSEYVSAPTAREKAELAHGARDVRNWIADMGSIAVMTGAKGVVAACGVPRAQ